jgi:hypothetical protein
MTRFLDVRLAPVGGNLATSVAIHQLTDTGDYQGLDPGQLLGDIEGRHVLIGTHGFNVNRASGIAALSNWERQLQLPVPSAFVGLLWPGDSIWAHGLDYPEEPRVASEAGALIGPFLDAHFGGAASISFASHSLGARVVLATAANMRLPVRRVMMMAGAIDDNCLNAEFQAVASGIAGISVLASKKDEVLSAIFPLGNLLAGIIAQGHPWWRGALGHRGPSGSRPGNLQAPFQIPDNWNFGHGSYLQVDVTPTPVIAIPAEVPPNGSALPAGGARGWQSAWSAAFASTRFR